VLSKATSTRKELLNQTIILSDSELDDTPGPERFLPEKTEHERFQAVIADSHRLSCEQSEQGLFGFSTNKRILNKRAKPEQLVLSTRPKRDCKKTKFFKY
jgi:hypothetical protein